MLTRLASLMCCFVELRATAAELISKLYGLQIFARLLLLCKEQDPHRSVRNTYPRKSASGSTANPAHLKAFLTSEGASNWGAIQPPGPVYSLHSTPTSLSPIVRTLQRYAVINRSTVRLSYRPFLVALAGTADHARQPAGRFPIAPTSSCP